VEVIATGFGRFRITDQSAVETPEPAAIEHRHVFPKWHDRQSACGGIRVGARDDDPPGGVACWQKVVAADAIFVVRESYAAALRVKRNARRIGRTECVARRVSRDDHIRLPGAGIHGSRRVVAYFGTVAQKLRLAEEVVSLCDLVVDLERGL